MPSASVTVETIVITYPRKLLAFARKLIDEGEYGISVVVAHIACEVATARTLSETFVAKGISDLEDPVTNLLSGYSLANPRFRKLYTALTGDEIAQEPFWAKFMASATIRNNVIHSSVVVTKADANESHQAATDLVDHLKKVAFTRTKSILSTSATLCSFIFCHDPASRRLGLSRNWMPALS